MGARIGRLGAFGTWGDAVIVTRVGARPARRAAPRLGARSASPIVDGRRRGQQLSQREFELKLASFEKRLDELDDAAILARVPPAILEKRGPRGPSSSSCRCSPTATGAGTSARATSSRSASPPSTSSRGIPGASSRSSPPTPSRPPRPPTRRRRRPRRPSRPSRSARRSAPPRSARASSSSFPAERLDSDTITALGKRPLDVLTSKDAVTGKQRDHIHQHGAGFIAPLEFLSEVFIEGKPLDRKRFEAEAQTGADGLRTMEAHLPRFGAVRILETGGKRWITSETKGDAAALLALQPR